MSSPMHRVSNDPRSTDLNMFNSAYFRYMNMAACHRLAYEIATCKSERIYHAQQAKDCVQKAAMLRDQMEHMRSACKARHHKHFIVPVKRSVIPIERYCHS